MESWFQLNSPVWSSAEILAMPRILLWATFSQMYIVCEPESLVVSVSWQFMQSARPICRPWIVVAKPSGSEK